MENGKVGKGNQSKHKETLLWESYGAEKQRSRLGRSQMWAVGWPTSVWEEWVPPCEGLHSLEYTHAPAPDRTNTHIYETDNKSHFLVWKYNSTPVSKGQQAEKALFALRL